MRYQITYNSTGNNMLAEGNIFSAVLKKGDILSPIESCVF